MDPAIYQRIIYPIRGRTYYARGSLNIDWKLKKKSQIEKKINAVCILLASNVYPQKKWLKSFCTVFAPIKVL